MMIRAYAARSAKGRLEPFEYDPGPIGPHQVDVQVTHCGICHTDVAMVDNDFGFTQYPLVPGHEAIGAWGLASRQRTGWRMALDKLAAFVKAARASNGQRAVSSVTPVNSFKPKPLRGSA